MHLNIYSPTGSISPGQTLENLTCPPTRSFCNSWDVWENVEEVPGQYLDSSPDFDCILPSLMIPTKPRSFRSRGFHTNKTMVLIHFQKNEF